MNSKLAEVLKLQGKSKNRPNSDFDSIELKIGTEIELEHTNDRAVAKEIAKDHLTEDVNYYKDELFADERKSALKKLGIKEPEKKKVKIEDVIEFLSKNPYPEDSVVHQWAEKNNYCTKEVEKLAYKLATKHVLKHEMKKSTDLLVKALSSSQKKAMKHSDKLGAGAKKRKKLKGQSKFDVVMAEFERGTLHSSDGKIVTDRDQAVAIAYSESGLKKSQTKIIDFITKNIHFLNKSKSYPEGTIRTWKGIKHQKKNGKWVKVGKGVSAKSKKLQVGDHVSFSRFGSSASGTIVKMKKNDVRPTGFNPDVQPTTVHIKMDFAVKGTGWKKGSIMKIDRSILTKLIKKASVTGKGEKKELDLLNFEIKSKEKEIEKYSERAKFAIRDSKKSLKRAVERLSVQVGKLKEKRDTLMKKDKVVSLYNKYFKGKTESKSRKALKGASDKELKTMNAYFYKTKDFDSLGKVAVEQQLRESSNAQDIALAGEAEGSDYDGFEKLTKEQQKFFDSMARSGDFSDEELQEMVEDEEFWEDESNWKDLMNKSQDSIYILFEDYEKELQELSKARKMEVGHITTLRSGKRVKKIGEGKWIPIREDKVSFNLSNLSKKDIQTLQKDTVLRNQFVMENQAFISQIIKDNRMSLMNWDTKRVDYPAMYQEGNVGFLQAIKRYDPKKYGSKAFSTYLYKYIHGYMARAANKESLFQQRNMKNLDDEIAQTMGDGKKTTRIETVSKEYAPSEEQVKRGQSKVEAFVNKLKSELTNEKAKQVVDLMIQAKSRAEIARQLGLTLHNVLYHLRVIKKVGEKYKHMFMKSQTEPFMKSLEENMKSLKPSDYLASILEKARSYSEGTIRTWKGVRYKKQNGKWMKISKPAGTKQQKDWKKRGEGLAQQAREATTKEIKKLNLKEKNIFKLINRLENEEVDVVDLSFYDKDPDAPGYSQDTNYDDLDVVDIIALQNHISRKEASQIYDKYKNMKKSQDQVRI